MFTEWVTSTMSEESYRILQLSLLVDPTRGRVVKGGGGIRKLRWGTESGGKRGGLRIIYYLALSQDRILMLYGYSKAEISDLTREQISILGELVKKELK